MAIAVEMPKMSDTMEEGVLVAWTVDEGTEVAAGDVIAQVETDKATMDLEVYDDGVLLKKLIGEGDAVPIGGLIAVLGSAGEDISSVLAKYGGGDGAAAPTEQAPAEAADEDEATAPEAAAEAAAETAPSAAATGDGRVKASPLARKIAHDRGIDLAGVQGSGPEGRIVKRDVEGDAPAAPAAKPQATPAKPSADRAPAPAAPSLPGEAYESGRISQMRKTIARRLAESKFTAPHFYLTIDVDVARLAETRKQLNLLGEKQGTSKISFNDFITKASALALRQHPQVNASYLEAENELRFYKEAHVAVAVAMDEGLITPVVRNADQKGLAQIAEETKALAGRARDGQLDPSEYQGSTFTTSNLGMFGVEEFTAIINPPNACILAIGGIRQEPVVKDGEIVVGQRMKLTLSCDHRIVDGASGAQFLATLKAYLEEPMNMLM